MRGNIDRSATGSRAAHVHRHGKCSNVARSCRDPYAQCRGLAAQCPRANSRCIDCGKQLRFKCSSVGIGVHGAKRAHQSALGQPTDFVKRGAHAYAHHQRRASVCGLFTHTGKHGINNTLFASAWRKHNHTAGIVGAAAFQHHMQTANPRLIDKMNLAESRCIVLRVAAVEQRIFYHRFTQTRIDVRFRNRIVHTREHITRNQHVRASFQAHPYRTRVLTDRHAVICGNASILHQLVQNDASTGSGLGFTGSNQTRQDIVGNARGQLRDKRQQRRLDIARGYR